MAIDFNHSSTRNNLTFKESAQFMCGYLPLEKVYKYDPVPEELTEEQEEFILGGQANLWTEYMVTMDHVEYMAFPRALALTQSTYPNLSQSNTK
jgi:hexosaminidase